MFELEQKQMKEISSFAGTRVDYTQGGGGNTSVKFDGKLMAIKASGFRLCDITELEGYVTVRYQDVANYYKTVDTSLNKDFETESVEISKASVQPLEGMKANLRPSVEVGFHSVLDKYVIHTHSVYANLLTCTASGEDLAKEIFKNADYNFIWLPYITPGFTLTLRILEKLKTASGKKPEVIFMQNHGLVVHSDDIARVKFFQDDVNNRIMEYFKIGKKDFSKVAVEKINDCSFKSATFMLLKYLEKNEVSILSLDSVPLYPDQLVYLNNTVRLNPEKMTVKGGNVYYETNEKEANTLEETLAAYIYIVAKLKELKLPISIMGGEDVKFINNWEVEKFRRSQAK